MAKVFIGSALVLLASGVVLSLLVNEVAGWLLVGIGSLNVFVGLLNYTAARRRR